MKETTQTKQKNNGQDERTTDRTKEQWTELKKNRQNERITEQHLVNGKSESGLAKRSMLRIIPSRTAQNYTEKYSLP